MKRKLTLVGVVVALAAFSLVSVAAASAHGFGRDPGDEGSSAFLDRVAEILGISSDDLQNAMDQARSEERAARLADRLAQAVEDGVLTQEEADAISDWFAGRPEALDNLTHSQQFELRRAVLEETLGDFLAGLVTDEVLTQAESDEISAWFDARPTDALEKIRPEFGFGPGRGFGHGPFGGHHRGFGFGGGPRGFGGFPGYPPATEPDSTTEDSATDTAVAFY